MKNISQPLFCGALIVAILAGSPSAWAGQRDSYVPTRPRTEPELIKLLDPSNSADTITDAIGQLETLHNADASCTNSIPILKQLLADTRQPVRMKAGRVLGVFHAPMSEADLKLVCAQLRAPDSREVQAGLKSLRGMNAASTVPDILPCLKHSNPYVLRDACRTLAVIGTKDVIPDIEPLLNNPDPKVRQDADDALAILRARQ